MVESSKRVKPWRRQVAAAYRDHCFGDMLDGPVSVTVDFYLPRPKSHYGTGRNAGALKPSAPAEHLIVAWHAYKHYATTTTPVGAQITIQELRRC